MLDQATNAAFETAFFAIVEDLGLTKEELAQARDRVSFQLENVYREYCAVPKERQLEALGHYARIFVEQVRRANRTNPSTDTELPSLQDIFPVLRPRAYFVHTLQQGQLLAQGKPIDSPFYTRPFTEHFSIGLVADDGKRMNVLSEKQVAEFKLDPEDIYEQALENLRQAQPLPLEKLADGIYASDNAGYGYDGSMILLPECLDGLELNGPATAFVTNSHRLLIVGLNGLSFEHPVLKMIVDSVTKEHHPISSSPFIFTEDGWKESVAIRSSTFLSFWRRSWVTERIQEINTQRALLAKLQPELHLPEVYSIGLDLTFSPDGTRPFGELTPAQREAHTLGLSATDAPQALNEPFFLTDVIYIPLKDGERKTLLLQILMLELPGVVQTDDRYQPRLAHFTRNLTKEEVLMLEKIQEPILQRMANLRT